MRPSPCPLCAADDWLALENIREDRSVRTDGGVVGQPLAKFHCAACGLAMRFGPDEDPVLLYAEGYQLYANRPGAERFDAARYANLTDALAAAWGDRPAPTRVLEAGCGDGSLLQAVTLRWSGAEVLGLEPSASAVELAQAAGRSVFQGMIGRSVPPAIAQGGFALIYAVHVIEHTPDPSAFLRGLGPLLAPGGRIVITCPDGAIPHAELVHCDHLFSMTHAHLAEFARRGGQTVLQQGDCPAGTQAEFSQLMVCAPGAPASAEVAQDRPAAAGLYRDRQAYLHLWKGLEAALMASAPDGEPLYCFGAGGWTGNIAGYCPALWERIAACAVDGAAPGARVQGKDVLDYRALCGEPRRFIAVVNPASQARIAARLVRDGHTVVPWPPQLTA